MSSLGQGAEWDPEEFDSVVEMIAAFKFGIFLTVLESKYAKDVDEGGMREAIGDVHDYYVLDVLKKVTIQIWASIQESRKGRPNFWINGRSVFPSCTQSSLASVFNWFNFKFRMVPGRR